MQTKTGEEKGWDIIDDKFPATIEELQVEVAQEEGYVDDCGLAFEYLFNEQTRSEASKVRG